MKKILPGVLHWTAQHEKIGVKVSSYYLVPEQVLLDPMLPAGGLDALAEHGSPTDILLANRHHYRHSSRFVERFGCRVLCHRDGLHEFTHGEPVKGFAPGDPLPGGVIAFAIDAICPDETALHIPRVAAVAFADGLVRFGENPLGFVPDHLLGDDPEGVKAGLRAAYARLLERDFEHLLLAHGGPVIGDGRRQLEAFLRES